MTAREVLNDGELGSSIRTKINNNFTELFDPDYFVAAKAATSPRSQSIPHATWTPILFDSPYSSQAAISIDSGTGAITFPIGGSDDASGAWMISGLAAWDNTRTGLLMHARKMRVRTVENGSTTKIWATSDWLFDPALGTTSPLNVSHSQVYAQPYISSSLTSCVMYIDLWHNAQDGGGACSIYSDPVGIEAPLIVGSRLSNYT